MTKLIKNGEIVDSDFIIAKDENIDIELPNQLLPLSIYLENILGVQFEIHYDYSVLELNTDNCSDGYNVDCELEGNSASYFTNTSIPGIFQGIAFSAMPFNIDDQFLNIKFDIIYIISLLHREIFLATKKTKVQALQHIATTATSATTTSTTSHTDTVAKPKPSKTKG